MTKSLSIGRTEIAEAHRAISPFIRRTPVMEIDWPARVHLKLEFLQHSGSFKARGAFANVLLRDVPQAGVVAASGGNHGAAVAYAAMRRGVPATIFVPTVCAPAKIERIRSYGAELVIGGDRYADALIASRTFVAESGALEVHAFDHPVTLAGAGTAGLEIDEQIPELDTLLVAVGGGGLIAGIASWFGGRIRIIGVEPEGAPTLTKALEAGEPVDAPAGSIAADSLAPRRVGELVFPIAQKYVSEVLLVTDDEIRAAQKSLWSVARIAAEPGGAAAFAALLAGRYQPAPNERVAVLVCGANTDAVRFE